MVKLGDKKESGKPLGILVHLIGGGVRVAGQVLRSYIPNTSAKNFMGDFFSRIIF